MVEERSAPLLTADVSRISSNMNAAGRQIIVQFRDAEGSVVGPELQLPLQSSRLQLQELLNQLQQADEPCPYAFKVSSASGVTEIETTIEEALEQLKGVTSETRLHIDFFPLATFRVRPVTRCTASIEAHTEAVLCLSFSPDSQYLASGSGDTTVRIWDLDTETPVKTLKGHTNWVLIVEWSPDCTMLASAGMDKIIKVWHPFEAEGGEKEAKSITLKGHSKAVTCLSWQPLHLFNDKQRALYLASASLDGTIRIWDVVQGITLLSPSGHTMPVTQIRFSGSSDGTYLYSCSRDTTLRVWDASTGRLVRDLKGHGHWVNTLALNTEYTIQCGPFDHTLESRSRTSREERIAQAKTKYCDFLKKNCGGKERLISGSDDCTTYLWEPLHSDKPIARLVGHQRPINHVQFSPSGRFIATASFDKSIRLWDGLTGKYLGVLRGHVGPVYRLAWSPDSRYIVTGSSDSTVKTWDVQNKKLKEDLPGHADEVYAVAWTLDGGTVASGSKDRYLKIWKH